MKKLVLIVEDEILIAHDIRQILEKEGFETVIGITSAAQAIRLVEELSPALVLIDINLNHQHEGINIGRYLLAANKVPYIYITSYTDKVTVDEVKDTRPYGFIAKPFKPEDIRTTIDIVLNNFAHRAVHPERSGEEAPSDVPFRIRKTIDYVNENIGQKIDIEEMARLTRWKAPHFIRLFTRYIGLTPYQYVLRRKVEKAKVLLEETAIPANEIAFELGFESYSNFNTAFKKITGTTPDAFRKASQARRL